MPRHLRHDRSVDAHRALTDARAALAAAAAELGVEFNAVESADENAYEPNVEGLVAEGCDIIITVGFLLAEATANASAANPDINFAIIDEFVSSLWLSVASANVITSMADKVISGAVALLAVDVLPWTVVASMRSLMPLAGSRPEPAVRSTA